MSQYINFYVKGKSGKRIPIGSYSRNSTLFKQCREFVPVEATAPLNNTTLEQIISSTEKAIIEEQQSISCIGDHIKDICSYNNSADEKDELILSYKESIKAIKEDIEDYKHALGVLRTYCDINDSLKYSEEEEWEGIEAGVEAQNEYINSVSM